MPDQQHDVKPRLPLNQVVFEEEYQEQPVEAILDYDKVQADYAGACDDLLESTFGRAVWSSRT